MAAVEVISPEQPPTKRLDAPPLLGLADDLLGEIFLRLPTLEDVGRAATACPTFRRVIAGRAFLRRLRSTHPPRLLGFFDGKDSFYPTEPPHSAPCARALVRALDFNFSFLPLPCAGHWCLRDVRDGRILFEKSATAGELAVVDPVSRRFALLPPLRIPDDLAAPVPRQRGLHLEPFLVPAREEEEPTSFRVICIAASFVFSSADEGGEWRAFPFQDWINTAVEAGSNLYFGLSWRCCVQGCLYWRLGWSTWLIVLDMHRMEFSFIKTHPGSFLHMVPPSWRRRMAGLR